MKSVLKKTLDHADKLVKAINSLSRSQLELVIYSQMSLRIENPTASSMITS